MADYKTIHGTTIKSYTTDPANIIEGQVWYDKTNKILQYQIPNLLSSWRTGGNLNTGRKDTVAGAGIQTAAVVFGGSTPPVTGKTETYNGTSFTEVADLNSARNALGGVGTSTSALGFGGEPPRAETESWNGSSWTEVSDLNTARKLAGAAGANNTAALAFGGYTTPPTAVN